ncbi:hypothetical protein [Nocardia brasiliensis]|uniref:hypothetical protein n=1 Tax=Nocardia brasiliensis TaxID=37326 RepID=UPI0024578C97|nr:hypothetical protein [Nocardia brasiliensis]
MRDSVNVDQVYAVGMQAFRNGKWCKAFVVEIYAGGFGQAARRGVDRAIQNALGWNAVHADSPVLRPVHPSGYRVISVAPAHLVREAATLGGKSDGGEGARVLIAIDLEALLSRAGRAA